MWSGEERQDILLTTLYGKIKVDRTRFYIDIGVVMFSIRKKQNKQVPRSCIFPDPAVSILESSLIVVVSSPLLYSYHNTLPFAQLMTSADNAQPQDSPMSNFYTVSIHSRLVRQYGFTVYNALDSRVFCAALDRGGGVIGARSTHVVMSKQINPQLSRVTVAQHTTHIPYNSRPSPFTSAAAVHLSLINPTRRYSCI